jgi:pimeloyl-ACP methyl ester carboxylesterase
MATFLSDGVEIYYEVSGEGAPVILVHGFASDLTRNWKDVGWFKWLNDAGYKVIALDCRGHGKSARLYDVEDYQGLKMPGDIIHLMDHLGIETAHLMGYSMGGMISARLIQHHEDRFEKVILAGVGGSMVEGAVNSSSAIADALLADDVDSITNPTAKGFRIFADASGGDRKALATYMQAGRPSFTKEDFAGVKLPVLIVAGEKDELVGDPNVLASCFENGRAVVPPRRDHLNTVGDKVYREAVIEFLDA